MKIAEFDQNWKQNRKYTKMFFDFFELHRKFKKTIS